MRKGEYDRLRKAHQYIALPDGTTWPDPRTSDQVAYRLNYGTHTRRDLLFAASVMRAYKALLATAEVGGMTQKERNRRCKELTEEAWSRNAQ